MSPQNARSELMKFDSGPVVGTLRSENESGVRLGVIAQFWTSGIFGGLALSGAATSPIASALSSSSKRSFTYHLHGFAGSPLCGRPPSACLTRGSLKRPPRSVKRQGGRLAAASLSVRRKAYLSIVNSCVCGFE